MVIKNEETKYNITVMKRNQWPLFFKTCARNPLFMYKKKRKPAPAGRRNMKLKIEATERRQIRNPRMLARPWERVVV
mgnify:CR=1 FL=1